MPLPYVALAEDGASTFPLAATVATDTTIKTGSGYLGRVLVTSANGAAALNIYDSASGHTGTIIGVIAASATVGTIVTFGMPFTLGLTVQGAATNGAVTISYY